MEQEVREIKARALLAIVILAVLCKELLEDSERLDVRFTYVL